MYSLWWMHTDCSLTAEQFYRYAIKKGYRVVLARGYDRDFLSDDKSSSQVMILAAWTAGYHSSIQHLADSRAASADEPMSQGMT